MNTRFTELVGIALPVVQAPMAGGPGTPSLVAAVSTAGGLGTAASGYLGAGELERDLAKVRELTDAPFAVNLFVDSNVPEDVEVDERVLAVVDRLRGEVGLPPLDVSSLVAVPPDDLLGVVCEARPRLASFTFGPPPLGAVEQLHDAGVLVMGTATTVAEAIVLDDVGVDAVCVQGVEAGAHSGGFDGVVEPAETLMALVPAVVDAVTVPVVAAGALMDGRGLAAVLMLGAHAAQCGSAFLLTPEAGTTSPHRRALAAPESRRTTLTRSITGRFARAIPNRLSHELGGLDVPPYPVMHRLTAELRRHAAAFDRPELMALWAGQAARSATTDPAAVVVRRMVDDARRIVAKSATSFR